MVGLRRDRAGAGRVFAQTEIPELTAPVLVVHDRGDAEIPWQHGAAIARAWRGAEMLITEGLGHRRILRDPGLDEPFSRLQLTSRNPLQQDVLHLLAENGAGDRRHQLSS